MSGDKLILKTQIIQTGSTQAPGTALEDQTLGIWEKQRKRCSVGQGNEQPANGAEDFSMSFVFFFCQTWLLIFRA